MGRTPANVDMMEAYCSHVFKHKKTNRQKKKKNFIRLPTTFVVSSKCPEDSVQFRSKRERYHHVFSQDIHSRPLLDSTCVHVKSCKYNKF